MLFSAWGLGGLTWKELARRVWSEMSEDDVWGRAAQLSYYFLLALFPLLLFLTTLLGYFADAGSELRAEMLRFLGQVVPAEASDLIFKTVEEVEDNAGGGKLSFGVLATLWAASNGMGAITEALNVAYEVKESRPWWKARLVAVGLTLGLTVLIASALVLILFGETLAGWVAASWSFGSVFVTAWKILQWPVALVFVLAAFALIYYAAPNVKKKSWQWITPGTVTGVLLWLLVSFVFRLYLGYFNSYSATYGALGAVIILMLWFYLTGAAILIGGEVNSEIAFAEAGFSPDDPMRGERQPGEAKAGEDQRRETDDPKLAPGKKTPGEIAAAERRREREKREK
ncbi:MAG TPA: YihY/virulence factor BrkB family protein [Pyrinomonadaceae bacterium]|nr:YihY/virulence factor BrkB family protein [Pyrinomonadaceae bacterium]